MSDNQIGVASISLNPTTENAKFCIQCELVCMGIKRAEIYKGGCKNHDFYGNEPKFNPATIQEKLAAIKKLVQKIGTNNSMDDIYYQVAKNRVDQRYRA